MRRTVCLWPALIATFTLALWACSDEDEEAERSNAVCDAWCDKRNGAECPNEPPCTDEWLQKCRDGMNAKSDTCHGLVTDMEYCVIEKFYWLCDPGGELVITHANDPDPCGAEREATESAGCLAGFY